MGASMSCWPAATTLCMAVALLGQLPALRATGTAAASTGSGTTATGPRQPRSASPKPAPLCPYPFCDYELPEKARLTDLVERLNVTEMVGQLTEHQTAAIPRLGIKPYSFYGACLSPGCHARPVVMMCIPPRSESDPNGGILPHLPGARRHTMP